MKRMKRNVRKAHRVNAPEALTRAIKAERASRDISALIVEMGPAEVPTDDEAIGRTLDALRRMGRLIERSLADMADVVAHLNGWEPPHDSTEVNRLLVNVHARCIAAAEWSCATACDLLALAHIARVRGRTIPALAHITVAEPTPELAAHIEGVIEQAHDDAQARDLIGTELMRLPGETIDVMLTVLTSGYPVAQLVEAAQAGKANRERRRVDGEAAQ